MNLLLLHPDDFIQPLAHSLTHPQRALIQGRRAEHLLSVNGVEQGSWIRAGIINGNMGRAQVVKIHNNRIELETQLQDTPPTALPLELVIALPRPKMLKRILQTIATMGVKKLTFVNSYRVEKSYWQSPWLAPEAIKEQLLLGLEQGMDTRLPEVQLEKRFKPFVEDRLPQLCQDRRALVAHPYRAQPCPAASNEDTLLVIGPEGGFIDYEVEKLQQAGCTAIHLGERILRVETAVPVLLAKLFH